MPVFVPSCADDQVGVDGPLRLVQSTHKRLLLSCAHLHDVPPYLSEVNGGRRRQGGQEERRKRLLKINIYISFFPDNKCFRHSLDSCLSPHLWGPTEILNWTVGIFFFFFRVASADLGQHPLSYPQRSSDHSSVQSARVDSGRSCSQWNSHYTGSCGWRISAATSLCRHVQHKGTGDRGAGCLQRWPRTGPSPCWSHTRPPPPPKETGSTGRSAAPRGSRTPGGTGPAFGWHTGSPAGDPISTCCHPQRRKMKEGGRRVEKERGNALRVENCFTSIFFSKPLIMFRDVGGRQPHAFVKTKTKKK